MAWVAWTAVKNKAAAEKLARGLVQEKLAACVSVIPGVVSHYRWKGKPARSREFLLMIKTDRKRWLSLSRSIRKNHPYELPELIALPVTAGSKEYLSWLNDSLK